MRVDSLAAAGLFERRFESLGKPHALWDARFASVLVPGPATPPGRLNLMLPARDGEALIDGCLPVAVMVGEDAR